MLTDDAYKYFYKAAKALGLNPKNILLISSNDSYVFKFGNRGNSYAFKMALKDTLVPEIFFIKTLKKFSIPCQELVAYNISRKIIPYPFFITKWIEADSFVGHINDKVAIEGGIAYGKELVKIHKIKVSGFGIPSDLEGKRWTSRSWTGALEDFFKKYCRLDTPYKLFNKDEVGYIFDIVFKNKKLDIPRAYLLHGDVPNSLALKKPNIKLLAFIDPGRMIGGDPMFDLASIYNINEKGEFGKGFMKGLIAGYSLVKPLTSRERCRFRYLRLFHLFWKTCLFYDKKWNCTFLLEKTRSYLNYLQTKQTG